MITRRSFAKNMIGGLSFAALGQSHAQDNVLNDFERVFDEDLLIGGGRYIDLESGEEKFTLSLIRPSDAQPNLIPLDFYPHGITAKPNNPSEIMVMEKKGPGGALVDINLNEVLLDLTASKDCLFYGHGAFTKDSDQLFIVETNQNSSRGLLSIRDASNGQIIGEMDTYGANPHDCHLIENGNFLAITNAGMEKGSSHTNAAPCVTYIDADSGKLLEKIPLTNADINAGHLLVTENSDLAVISAPREGLATSEKGGISLRPSGLEMQSLSAPVEVTSLLAGETLSLAYHSDTGTLAATTPDAGLVTFWNMKDRTFISAVRMPFPRGICLSTDMKHFLVSAGEIPALYSINTDDLSKIEQINQNAFISGSHLYNWNQL